MHYNIKYDSEPTDAAAQEKALQDIRDYVGADKFSELDALLRQQAATTPLTLRAFELQLFLFPIHAWYHSIYQPDDNDDNAL